MPPMVPIWYRGPPYARRSVRRMRFSISIPQIVADGAFDADGMRAYLARAEELGFDGAWTVEGVVNTMPQLAPLETLTFAASCTQRLRLGCAVFVSSLHSPLHLAKSVSSLDQISRGRVEVGLGTGGPRQFPAFGLSAEGYVTRFTEVTEVMKAVWTQERATYDGRFFQLDGVPMEPKPFQKPRPPVWYGGHHPNALRRAVRHADGFFGAGSATTAAFAEEVRTVREEMKAQDRPDFRIAKRIYIAVDDDPERARTRMAEALVRYYRFQNPNADKLIAVAVTGTPDDCVRGVQEVADAGAEMILLNPLFDDAEQMERLAAEVMPRVA